MTWWARPIHSEHVDAHSVRELRGEFGFSPSGCFGITEVNPVIFSEGSSKTILNRGSSSQSGKQSQNVIFREYES